MARGNWEDFGSTIKDIVEDAVAHQDFTKLNQTVNNVINDAANNVRSSFGAGMGRDYNGQFGERQTGQYTDQNTDAKGYGNHGRNKERNGDWNRARNQHKEGYEYRSSAAGNSGSQVVAPQSGNLYASALKLKSSGLAMAIVGYIFAGIFGVLLFVFLLSLLTSVAVGSAFWIVVYAMVPLFVGSLILGGCGKSLLGRTKRFQQYLKGLGEKTYCNISELASLTGSSPGFIKRDLRKMIQKGWFLEGHLDDEKTCLITDHTTFQEYQLLKQQKKDMISKEKAAPKSEQPQPKPAQEKPVTEAEQVIREGEAYIREIQKSNDAIPGEEISNKISRMELLVRRIFERIQEHPEQLDDIQKLMNYYLPTTVKLLHAYEELDVQPVQGENIRNSKKEIEATLDTLNFAFEKLLDNLFQDTAWDVSSDISVLHTMLSQEGLTKNDFQREETK